MMNIDPIYFIYLFAAISSILFVETIYLIVTRSSSYRRQVNRRLRTIEKSESREKALFQLRHHRGLNTEGRYVLPVIWFNRLFMQSGVRMGIWQVVGLMLVLLIVLFLLLFVWQGRPVISFTQAFIIAFGAPTMVLLFMRRRRRKQFAAQLPEALDVMVRSLRAGHPIPVSLSLVSTEMPDPVGTEFGIASDELTYGMDLETVLSNLTHRVGQEDLPFVVVAVSIQSETGGNLGEILSNLSTVLRERFRMRLKVRALSAEGRFSAIALMILPFALFGMLAIVAPTYYGAIWSDALVKPILGFGVGWMALGGMVLYKMVNFKF